MCIRDRDFVYPEPFNNVIFLDNHDTERFYGTMGKDIRKYKMGFALLMINRGIPQMYYGAEINLFGTRAKGDGDIRKDFPMARSIDLLKGKSITEGR